MTESSSAANEAGLRAALSGKRIVVTRPGSRGEDLASRLRSLGATPVLIQLLTIEAPQNQAPLNEALLHLDKYDWIAFASVNAVHAVAAHHQANLLLAEQKVPRIAAVGVATAASISRMGWGEAVTPDTTSGAGLGVELPIDAGDRVLLPRAESGLTALAVALRARGANVTEVIAYRTRAKSNCGEVFKSLQAEAADAFTFTSPSTLTQFMLSSSRAGYNLLHAQRHEGFQVVCIGETTAAAARLHGLHVNAIASEQSEQGLVEAIATSFGQAHTGVTAGPQNHG